MRLRRRSPTLAALLATALTATLWAGSALALPPPLAESLTGTAKSAYDGAHILYEVKDYAGAATKYRAAFRESHDARLLWNIATCERGLRHYAATAILIEEFLRSASPLVPPEFLDQARMTLAALREFYSPVRFTVHPAGAHISIDDEEVGIAPLAAPVPVDLGKHTFRVVHDGYSAYEKVIDIGGQGEVPLEITLPELSTVANLVIDPSDLADTISVDEKVVGSGRWQGDLRAGPHRIKVTAPGKKTYRAEIEVAAGEHRSIDVTLDSEQGRPIWPWIVGGAAVVAGAIVGGAILLRPGDVLGAPPSGSSAGTIQLSSFGRHGLK